MKSDKLFFEKRVVYKGYWPIAYRQTGWSCHTRLKLRKTSFTLKQKTINVRDILTGRTENLSTVWPIQLINIIKTFDLKSYISLFLLATSACICNFTQFACTLSHYTYTFFLSTHFFACPCMPCVWCVLRHEKYIILLKSLSWLFKNWWNFLASPKIEIPQNNQIIIHQIATYLIEPNWF